MVGGCLLVGWVGVGVGGCRWIVGEVVCDW